MAFTAENIAATCVVDEVKLSPEGTRLVYRVSPAHRSGDYRTSSIWYSPDITKAESAKQLTDGEYDDGCLSWHPNARENTLYFLSDRHCKGGPRQIYRYALDGAGEPHIISDRLHDKKRATTSFRISPDGLYVAYCSADELDQEQERKLAEKDDAQVWGDHLANARLRLYTISTGEIRTLVPDNKHIASYTWSADSKRLLYVLCDGPDAEFRFGPHTACVISILDATTTRLVEFDRAPAGEAIWPSHSHQDVFYLYTYIPHNKSGAFAVYRHSPDMNRLHVSESERFYLGDTEDPMSLVDLYSDGEFAVGVATGMDTRVDILDRDGKICTLYETSKREAIESFDVKKVESGYVMACIRSSGPDQEAPNIWVGHNSGKHNLRLTTKVSPSHFAWTASSALGPIERFEWQGENGLALDGMAWFPHGVDPFNITKPLPTILHIHGGPYSVRETPGFYPSSLAWQPVLAERGFLVLSPNYRGSMGRGHAFARLAPPPTASLTTGWSDVATMVDAAITRGWADRHKLAVGGWSFGGYLAAWGVSQTKRTFRCGVMGAGLSDWAARAISSDLPDVGDEIGGTAPWVKGLRVDQGGDPIRHVDGIETAMLVVHGERDARVPASQGVGFHRGLRRMSAYRERHTLVVYPREGHLFEEKKHVEDLVGRVMRHYETWLK